jgi:dihydroorotase
MTLDLLIRGARVVSSTEEFVADVGVRDGQILEIGDLGSTPSSEVIEAKGLTLISGAIDTQVHFREPGLEHKEDIESGTRSAIVGGVTSILEMPNTNPTTTTKAALEDKLQRAEGRAHCNYGFFIGASTENLDSLAELENLPGVPGIKIFVGSSTGSLLVEDEAHLRMVLRNGHKRCAIHAEDEGRNRERKSLISGSPHPREHPYLRDAESALIATRRMIRLCEETGRPIHILHITTADEPVLIAEAKRRGLPVTAEVTPQHLYFAGPEAYDRLGSLAQMNPPIREEQHREGLWRALNAGVFDVFGSDHAPHTLDEKSKPYPQSPSGMPGVQTLLPVLLTFVAQGRLSMSRLVAMLCENPATLYGMIGKGRLDVGFDADLVLVDPEKSYTFTREMVQSKCGWSPYEGERLTGSIEHVILGGKHVVSEGELLLRNSGRQLAIA